jgi:hypothetical protein
VTSSVQLACAAKDAPPAGQLPVTENSPPALIVVKVIALVPALVTCSGCVEEAPTSTLPKLSEVGENMRGELAPVPIKVTYSRESAALELISMLERTVPTLCGELETRIVHDEPAVTTPHPF